MGGDSKEGEGGWEEMEREAKRRSCKKEERGGGSEEVKAGNEAEVIG